RRPAARALRRIAEWQEGGAAAMSKVISGVVSGLAAPLFELVDALFTSDEERAEARRRLLEMEQRGELAQVAVNLQEARSESLFVAGWRPFIGWSCGAALAY